MSTPNNNPPPTPPDPLAVALSKLEPAPHGFEWNQLMFAAGQASKTRALNFWRIVALLCALIAGGFAFAYYSVNSNIQRERPMMEHESRR